MSTTTDWILALSSTAAAAGTVGTLYFSILVLKRQQDETRRQQAVKVLVTGDTPESYVTIYNGSEHAIYGVLTWIFAQDGRAAVSGDQYTVVVPGETVTADTAPWTGYGKPEAGHWQGRVEVAFGDEAGHRWIRDTNGPLREVPITRPSLRDRARSAWLNARQRRRDRRATKA